MIDKLDKQTIDMFDFEKAVAIFLDWMSPFLADQDASNAIHNQDSDEPIICKPN